MSTTDFEMNCGSPIVGWVCIRKPGAAFTSTIASSRPRLPRIPRLTGQALSRLLKQDWPRDVDAFDRDA